MLLMHICGVKRIDGLTKMAKLDFFARYPDFFEAARSAIAPKNREAVSDDGPMDERVELAMIRHHYGPWEKRY